MGYGNSTLRTIFPVSVVSPSTPRTTRYYDAAEARTGTRRLSMDNESKHKAIVPVAEPKYKTESEVTMAIILKELTMVEETNEAYRLAIEYQAYLKKIAKPKFFPKKTIQVATGGALNFRAGYCMK